MARSRSFLRSGRRLSWGGLLAHRTARRPAGKPAGRLFESRGGEPLMMQKPLAAALLGAIGLAVMSDAGAATHARVQAPSMGKLAPAALANRIGLDADRSEERRVGKHCRAAWRPTT